MRFTMQQEQEKKCVGARTGSSNTGACRTTTALRGPRPRRSRSATLRRRPASRQSELLAVRCPPSAYLRDCVQVHVPFLSLASEIEVFEQHLTLLRRERLRKLFSAEWAEWDAVLASRGLAVDRPIH